MGNSWEDVIEDIVGESGSLVKNEIRQLLDDAKNDSEDFLRRQADKIDNYLNQLANNEISKEQFESYLLDIKDLTEMHSLKLSVAARARAQRLADGITDIILNKLLSFI